MTEGVGEGHFKRLNERQLSLIWSTSQRLVGEPRNIFVYGSYRYSVEGIQEGAGDGVYHCVPVPDVRASNKSSTVTRRNRV